MKLFDVTFEGRAQGLDKWVEIQKPLRGVSNDPKWPTSWFKVESETGTKYGGGGGWASQEEAVR